jgi:hypothetical protein
MESRIWLASIYLHPADRRWVARPDGVFELRLRHTDWTGSPRVGPPGTHPVTSPTVSGSCSLEYAHA